LSDHRCLPISPNPRVRARVGVRVRVRVGVMVRVRVGVMIRVRVGVRVVFGRRLGLGLRSGLRHVLHHDALSTSVCNNFVHVRHIGIRRNGAEP